MTLKSERQVQESYRKAALFLSKVAATQPGMALQVASATRQEGTTTVVLTLASRLREIYGLRVLVVEIGGDDLARLLELDRDRNLASFAAGRTTAADSIQTSASGISVISGSPQRLPAGELIVHVRRLLKDVEVSFDLVLLDVPPVLGSADSLVVGSVVPRLLLVVEAGRTRYEVVQRAKKELEAEGIEIIATVLNKHRRFVPGWVYRWLIR